MLVEELLKRIRDIQERVWPQTDRSRSVTLTGSALTLPNESCKTVTIINTTGANVILTINGGNNITLPTSTGLEISVTNTNLITANGTLSAALSYIISE